jgi:hypothetical protein
MDVTPEAVVHRVGGAAVENFRLSAVDRAQSPPGLSVLLGGTAGEAALRLRTVFHRSKKWKVLSQTVGSSTVAAIRAAGFDVIPDPTPNFPNHGRIIHAQGLGGFSDDRLSVLAGQFVTTEGY